MTQPQTAAEAVANGAQLLDERVPGWWRKIDQDMLDLTSCSRCVCGQLALATYDEARREQIMMRQPIMMRHPQYGSAYYYGEFLEQELGLEEDWRHGFNIVYAENGKPPLYEWEDLEVEWKRAIDARLEADKLAADLFVPLDELSQQDIDEIAELTGVHL